MLQPGQDTTRTESPYFPKPPRTRPSFLVGSKSSPFFLRSSSSVHGSVGSLGATWATWIPCKVIAKWKCDFDGTSKERPCQACNDVLRLACQTFQGCPIFETACDAVLLSKNQGKRGGDKMRDSCLEKIGPCLEECVRHLCPHQCYLRAYSPQRDWWTLRNSLMESTDGSIDEILRGWTCKLQCSNIGEQAKAKVPSQSTLETPRKRSRVDFEEGSQTFSQILPKTEFVHSSTGKRCHAVTQMLRALEIERDDVYSGRPKASMQNNESDEIWTLHRQSPKLMLLKKPSVSRSLTQQSSRASFAASPLGLLEELFFDNPWQLLMSTILLNRTRRIQVDGVFHELLRRWPDPRAMLAMAEEDSDLTELTTLITSLGIKHRRARGIIQFSREYQNLVKSKERQTDERGQQSQGSPHPLSEEKTMLDRNKEPGVEFCLTRAEIMSLYHCGEYSADAYSIFIRGKWNDLHPEDHALRAFVDWKRSQAVSKN